MVEWSILGEKEHFWGKLSLLGDEWSPLRALSACGQILQKNPGKGQTPPTPIQAMPVFWARMVRHPIPKGRVRKPESQKLSARGYPPPPYGRFPWLGFLNPSLNRLHPNDHWRGLCSVSGLIALPYLYSGPMLSPLSPFINIIWCKASKFSGRSVGRNAFAHWRVQRGSAAPVFIDVELLHWLSACPTKFIEAQWIEPTSCHCLTICH